MSLLQAKTALAQAIPLSRAQARGPAGTGNAADQKRWNTSLDFQTMFLSQMYKSMRETIDHSELTEPSFGRDMFLDMFDREIAAAPSHSPFESGPMGLLAAKHGRSTSLAAEIYRSLLHSEGGGSDPLTQPGMGHTPAGKPEWGQVDPLIREAAVQFSLPPNLLRGVIQAESNGDPAAVSSKGAKGLMQLMDTTASDMGVENPFDPRQNVFGGAKYLRGLLDRYGWNERKALAGYNAGPANVDRHGGVPPFPETQTYVDRVLRIRDALDAGGSP